MSMFKRFFRNGISIVLLGASVCSISAYPTAIANAQQPSTNSQPSDSNTVPQNSPVIAPSQNPPKKPRVPFFEQSSFLGDALGANADPLGGALGFGTKVSGFEGEALAATSGSQNQTLTGVFKLDISPELRTALNQNTAANFNGFGGSLTLTGDDGTVTNINATRTSFNTANLAVDGTTLGVTVNDFSGTGTSISGDPNAGLARLNAGTAGRITINGQPAIVEAGLSGNDAVLRFSAEGGQIFEIRAIDGASIARSRSRLRQLNLDSTFRGSLTIGNIPDR